MTSNSIFNDMNRFLCTMLFTISLLSLLVGYAQKSWRCSPYDLPTYLAAVEKTTFFTLRLTRL